MYAAPLLSGSSLLALAAAMRLAMIAFGRWQDAHMEVKYTDIDYEVFTDAAKYVCQGMSPFERSTYRYSPLLAYAVIPNVLLFHEWGKLLFSAADLFVGYQLGRMVRPPSFSRMAMALWLFNPFTFSIATRGNCESLVCALLLTIVSCISKGQVVVAAVLYGLAVHFRVFPIIYCLSLFLSLAPTSSGAHWTLEDSSPPTGDAAPQTTQECLAQQGPASDADHVHDCKPGARGKGGGDHRPSGDANDIPWAHQPRKGEHHRVLPCGPLWWISASGLLFGLTSAGVFFSFTAAFYWLYGSQFLNEALLYHASRTDHRHNFSIYFYSIYLSLGAGSTVTSLFTGLLAFVPQVACQLCLSIAFARRDLPFCMFAQTVAFVAFNKVITAQYFVWFFALLPLLMPHIHMTRSQVLGCSGIWLFSQLHWLAWAYHLEFRGHNVYFPLWLGSLMFFTANLSVLCKIIAHYRKPEALGSTLRKKID